MKQYMHKPDFTGMTAPGVFEGPPHLLFRAGVPNMELAPPFNPKVVDAVTWACVLARYNAVHCRLASLYPLDLERQETFKSKMATSHRLLDAKGSVPWNLSCHWLRRNDLQPAQGAAKEDTGTDEYSLGNGSGRELDTSVHDKSG
ncbi:unnamed protein product, partial [Sphacelaria rigidula]